MTTGHSTQYGGGGGGGGAPSGLGFTAISGLQRVIPGTTATPGWEVVGDYYYIAGKVKLEASCLLSTTALQGRFRLFDPITNAQVAGSVVTFAPGAAVDRRDISGDVSGAMVVNRLYQIQAECTGGATQGDFMTMRSARILES